MHAMRDACRRTTTVKTNTACAWRAGLTVLCMLMPTLLSQHEHAHPPCSTAINGYAYAVADWACSCQLTAATYTLLPQQNNRGDHMYTQHQTATYVT
jgi:hypothetical protein